MLNDADETDKLLHEKSNKLCQRNFYNLMIMSVAFLLVFTAFQTAQVFVGKLLGNFGSFSLGIVYASFSVVGFGAPYMAAKLGPRKAMFFACLGYTLYVGSLTFIITPLVLGLSVVIGSSAAVLWCAQGTFITQLTNENNRSFYSSLFWGILQLSVMPGNIASHFLLAGDGPNTPTAPSPPSDDLVPGWSHTNSPLFILLTALSGIGSCCFLLLRSVDETKGTKVPMQVPPPVKSMVDTFKLLLTPGILMLAPLLSLTGIELTFWASWITRQMYKTVLGLVISVFGVAELLGGLTLGKVGDTFGPSSLLIIGITAAGGAMGVAYYGNHQLIQACDYKPGFVPGKGSCYGPASWHYVPFGCAAFLMGIFDCSIQTLCQSLLGSQYSSDSSSAFALFRTLQALSAMFGFLITPALGDKSGSTEEQFRIEILILAGWCIVTVIGYLGFWSRYLTRGVKPPGVAKVIEEEDEHSDIYGNNILQ